MIKKLSYFNLIYGISLFALIKSEGDFYSLIAIAIILLYNWIILMEVDGKYIISKKTLNILMIICLIITLCLLITGIKIFDYLSQTDEVTFLMVFFVLLRMLFVFCVLFHLFAHWRRSSLR